VYPQHVAMKLTATNLTLATGTETDALNGDLTVDLTINSDIGESETLSGTALRLDYDGQTHGGAPLSSHTGDRDLEAAIAWRPLAAAAWGEGWLLLDVLQQRRQIASTAAASGLRETSTLVLPGLRWCPVASRPPAGSGARWRRFEPACITRCTSGSAVPSATPTCAVGGAGMRRWRSGSRDRRRRGNGNWHGPTRARPRAIGTP
jgi:hypothetical protein